jgi:predicted DNA-binding protein (MmcQ/YjbR family)
MKYYSEEDTKDLRLAFEDKVLQWPQVSSKKMFGCPCYQANGKLFAFFVTKGVVITQLTQSEREELSRQQQTTFFQAGKKIVKNWVRVPVKNKRDLGQIMPFVRKSYESAFLKA